MRVQLLAAALLVAGAASAGARSERTSNSVLEPAFVHAKLDGPIATLTARFVLPLAKESYEEARAAIALPSLGMVTAGTVTLGGVTHALALTDAEGADTQFNALAAIDDSGPDTGEHKNAVLIEGTAGNVTISLASAHSGVMTVELTVAAPTCFFRDARYVAVPEAWRKVADFSLRGTVPPDVDDACGSGAGREEAWIGFASPELVKRKSGERIGTFAGKVVLGEEHVARVEIDLSSVLSDIPRDLATVIVVDGSRSMSVRQLEAQRQLVASYLQKAPDSRVQVIAYARRARSLLPSWTTAAQAAGRVDRELRALAPRNGSNFDAALAEAGSWLERVAGTRRIILLTDELMAERLDSASPVTLKRMLPAGTLVHVLVVDETGEQPARTEEAKLAPLAAATDGMAVHAGLLDAPAQLDATLLVRPISLDRIEVKAPGWTELAISSTVACRDRSDLQLDEGMSCTWWGEGDRSSGPIVVEGLLWGKRVQRLLSPDPTRSRDLAREISALGSLEQPLLERANALARAVDDHWSLYGEWGGNTKYAAGFGFGRSGTSDSSSDDGIGTIGHGSGTGTGWPPPDLEPQLRPLLAACHVEADRIAIHLEMTLVEIVDVGVTLNAPQDTTPAKLRKQQSCVEDAMWDATPMIPHIQTHHAYDVELQPVH